MHPILRFCLAAPAAAVFLLPVRAAAQSGNQSDIAFPNTTGSGAAGGSFAGPGLRSVNALFASDALGTRFRSAGVGCTVRTAARMYADSVAAAPRGAGSPAVLALLLGTPSADAAAVASALSRGAPRAQEEARRLSDALHGLYAPPAGCPDDAGEFPEAGRWREAIRAYHALLRALPDAVLAPPPAELLTVHDALQGVLLKSTRRPGRR